MKIGDKVWVLCEVMEGAYRGHIECKNGSVHFQPLVSEVKPVEPEAVEQPEAVKPKTICVGDKVTWCGHKGIVSEWCEQTQKFCFQADNGTVIWVFGSSLSRVEHEAIEQSLASDPVNPSHYKQLPAETIDIIEAAIANAPNNKAAGLHWQVLKYVLRCWFKNGIEDLKKARWYLDRLIKAEETK